MTFGETLKAMLRERGLSYARAAERAGIEHSYLSRLCSGARMPGRETVAGLVAGLQLGCDEARRLYGAAGFLAPGTMAVTASGELAAAARMLGDASVPANLRDGLRRQIAASVEITRAMMVTS